MYWIFALIKILSFLLIILNFIEGVFEARLYLLALKACSKNFIEGLNIKVLLKISPL